MSTSFSQIASEIENSHNNLLSSEPFVFFSCVQIGQDAKAYRTHTLHRSNFMLHLPIGACDSVSNLITKDQIKT